MPSANQRNTRKNRHGAACPPEYEESIGRTQDAIYCNATCDGFLCWPPTLAGETLYQYCPKLLLINQNKCAYRRCGAEGLWLGRHVNDPKGWTNYTPCFPPLVQKILDKVNEDEAAAQSKFQTAINTRTIEMVGLILSWLSVCVSLIIFHAFRSLRNRRIVIHKNLFYALLMEETVRWILYTQQSYSFNDSDPEQSRRGIEYYPKVCEGAYILLEYSRLVVYAWMLIEGIFLNSLISANSLRNEIPIKYFYVGGWGGPVVLIAIWATVVGRHYAEDPVYTCWYGYNYLPSYYIIQGPILAIVGVNMLFLGILLSVIIMKLRRTNDSELRKIQKALRATIILLPLLGIINVFNLFDYPLNGSSTGFAVWAYFTHFFRSFQGVIISFIYCFLNGEVRKVIHKKFERRTWCRYAWMERRRRPLPIRAPEPPIFAVAQHEEIELVPLPIQTWTEPLSTHNVTDVEAGPIELDDMGDRNQRPQMGPPGRGLNRSESGHRIFDIRDQAGPSRHIDMGDRNQRPQMGPPGRGLNRSESGHRIFDIRDQAGPSRHINDPEYVNLEEGNFNRAAFDCNPNHMINWVPHRRQDMRTVAVQLPADDRPGASVNIHIERRSSADALGTDEVITVRRSSTPCCVLTPRHHGRGYGEMRRSSTPCYWPTPHHCGLTCTDSRKASAARAVHLPSCPRHPDNGNSSDQTTTSDDIPSIPPPPVVREMDSDSSNATSCNCNCFPSRPAKNMNKEAKRMVKMEKDLQRTNMHVSRSRSIQTLPRLGHREPFVRPGLVTRPKRSQSLNCI